MTTRRPVNWVRFSSGDTINDLTGGAVQRLVILSLKENEIGRQLEGFTVTRSLLNLYLKAATTPAIGMYGLVAQHKDVAIGSVNPQDDPHADWFYFEEFPIDADEGNVTLFSRDIRSMRKVRADQELYLYLENRTSGATLENHQSGSILLKS